MSDSTYNHPIETCPCGCGGSVLVVDDGPRYIGGSDNDVLHLFLPTHRLLDRAFRIGGDAKAKVKRGEVLTEEEGVVIGLLDALLVHREALTRIVVGMEIDTGSEEEDDALFDGGLALARDIVHGGFHTPTTKPGVITSARIDVTMTLEDLGDFPADHEEVDCDVDDCPIHGDKPVPTDYEA